jgi:adenylate kinase family enzyme
MAGKIIILTGYCATGKTTFSQKLSKQFNILCFNKDFIKAVLGKNLDIDTLEEKSRLSVSTFNILAHIMEIFMEQNKPIIIESNFKLSEGEIIRKLLEKYKYQSLTFLLVGDIKILHKRFLERDNSPERDKENRSEGTLDDYDKFKNAIKPLGEFNTGDKIIKIDTSDFSKVNYDKYIEEVKIFLDKK